ncbi:MAG: TonB-dependent receptor, partial [Acidobacteria bacterium]|nr:TonB-dependent receptor [Acidobacteriota bacterium]
MSFKARLLVAVLGIVAAWAPLARAQVQTGSILVRTVDEQGAVIPGATVTLNSAALQMNGVTDAGGVHRFPSLPPGTYTVKVELQGFRPLIRENIVVSVGQTAPLDVTLQVGGVTESVTVSGESPVVDTTSAVVGVNLDKKLLETTPGGRDIWSILEYKVPGLVMASPDVGGNQGGLQRGITARGTPNGQNTQMLNGVNVGDPAAIGFAGYYYDPSSFEDIQVSTGARDITVPTGGVFINMVTKSGTNRLGGMVLATYQAEATQSDNIDATLRSAGLRPNANAVDYISNFNVNLGGPIRQNKLFYFAALNDQRTHVNVVGFPAAVWTGAQEPEYTDITSIFARPTFQLNNSHRFDVTASRQLYDKPNRGASASNTPESTWHERDILAVYQGLWNWVINNQLFVDSRMSFNSIDFPLQLKTTKQTLLDLSTNIRTRANSAEQRMIRERLQISSNVQYYIPQWLGGRHEIRGGIDNAYTPDSVELLRNDNLEVRYRSLPQGSNPAGPAQVLLFNTPLFQKRAVQTTALYAQDSYSIGRLTVVGGVRWERVEGWLPAQSSPPSPWFPDGTVLTPTFTVRRSFDEIRNIPLWKNGGPRFNAIYDLTGEGKTALRFSLARYYDQIGTGTPGGLNTNGLITQTYTWNDLNGDLVFQPGEQGRLTGTNVPPTLQTLFDRRDPNLRRPYRNELTLGVDHELIPNLEVSATFFRNREHDPLTNVDLGRPFDQYHQVQRTDPGLDGVTGTSDDRTITVYNLNSTALVSQLQQRNDDRVAQRYKGVEFTATKRYSNGWTLLGGYTWSRTEVDMTSVENPNDAFVNASGRAGIDRTHNIKITGSYLLPWEVLFGANFRLLSGAPVTRTVPITGLNQQPTGNVTVNAEPRGSVLLPWLPTLDVRLGKIVRFARQ